MASHLQLINSSQPVPQALDAFQITAASGTDIWRAPAPSHERDDFSGPVLYRRLPRSAFRRARVTVAAEWEQQYDQGGLILVLPQSAGAKTKWIKAGVELLQGKPYVGVVAADRWADWSLRPHAAARPLTIEFERKLKGDTPEAALWIYAVEESGERSPVREVTWVFEETAGDSASHGELWLGVYAARPQSGLGDLTVSMSYFTVETV
jgi:hypothetical protein